MRRPTARFGALLLALWLPALPAAAQFSVGLHAGFDLNAQDAEIFAAAELADGTWVSLEREEIESPLLGGLHLRFSAAPLIDIEIGVEGSLREYAVAYEHRATETGTAFPGERFAEEAQFARLSVYGSGKLNLVDLPLMKVYAGAGAGYHLITPLLSLPLLEAKIVDKAQGGAALGPADILAREGVWGGHILAGLRVKPNFLPLALGLEGRYHALTQNDYGDETHRFGSVVFALELGF